MLTEDLLEHEWFEDPDLEPEVSEDEMKDAIKNLHTFSRASKF